MNTDVDCSKYCIFTDDDDVLHYGLLHLSTFYNVGADDDVDYEEDEYEDYDVDDDLYALNMHLCNLLVLHIGVVGCDKGIVYLTSPGRPTDIGLQLGKLLARPAILVADMRGRWGGGGGGAAVFLILLFLYFHSYSSFFSVPLFYLLFYLFSPFIWETTQNDPQGLTCC